MELTNSGVQRSFSGTIPSEVNGDCEVAFAGQNAVDQLFAFSSYMENHSKGIFL